jgi:hypothetical protein
VVAVRRIVAPWRARGAAWALAALRWCLVLAAVVLSVAVAELANDAHARAPPTTQDTVQRDSRRRIRETEELEASCITICFSLRQRKNPCKIKSLRGFPKPDVEPGGPLANIRSRHDGSAKLSNATNLLSADATTNLKEIGSTLDRGGCRKATHFRSDSAIVRIRCDREGSKSGRFARYSTRPTT